MRTRNSQFLRSAAVLAGSAGVMLGGFVAAYLILTGDGALSPLWGDTICVL